jgi:hypothetical protein
VHVVFLPPATQVSEGQLADMDILDDVTEGEEESLADDAHFLGDDDEVRTW